MKTTTSTSSDMVYDPRDPRDPRNPVPSFPQSPDQREFVIDLHDGHKVQNDSPCMHDMCQECSGTGIRKSGGMCVHAISCPCKKCTLTF